MMPSARPAKTRAAGFVNRRSKSSRTSSRSDVEVLSRQANLVSKSIGQAKDDAEREARKDEGRRIRESKEQILADIEQIGRRGAFAPGQSREQVDWPGQG